jgi:hypothetical protein
LSDTAVKAAEKSSMLVNIEGIVELYNWDKSGGFRSVYSPVCSPQGCRTDVAVVIAFAADMGNSGLLSTSFDREILH